MFPRLFAVALSALCLVLLAVLSCSKKDGDTNGVGGDDGDMPYVILDLRVAAVSDSSVTLAWTATGDDADRGTAAKYDIRYATVIVNDANWSTATQAVGESSPKVAGSAETFEVRGLMADSTYYFALRTCDEANNCPILSTCGPATCFTDFEVDFPDSVLEQAVRLAINKLTGQIYRSDLMTLSFLAANNAGLVSLSGLEYCPSLSVLFMSHNSISDLTPLANLRGLLHLQLNVNSISDMSPLTNLYNIETLMLRNNNISTISGLSYNFRVRLLDLRNNSISDVGVLVDNPAFATNDTLYISGNPLSQTALDSQITTLTARGVTVIN